MSKTFSTTKNIYVYVLVAANGKMFKISKGIYGSQFPIQFVQIRSHFADSIEKQKWHMIDPGKTNFGFIIIILACIIWEVLLRIGVSLD